MRVEELKQRDEAMASLPGIDSTHIDDLLLSLMDPPTSPRPPSVASSVETKAGGSPPAKSCAAKREQAFDDEGFRLDDRGLPLATDDESRRARKMARNRRAAADSRARKKERTDELEARVAALEAENQQLRSRLARAEGLPSVDGEEKCEKQEDQTDTRWPISPQPAALRTYSLKWSAQLPWMVMIFLSRLLVSRSARSARPTCPLPCRRIGGSRPSVRRASSSALRAGSGLCDVARRGLSAKPPIPVLCARRRPPRR